MSAALIEYGTKLAGRRWMPALWIDGVEADGEALDVDGSPLFCVRLTSEQAEADARDAAIQRAAAYLGRGGVTVRLRVEPATPPVLGPESTIAELSAELKRLKVTELYVFTLDGGWRARPTCIAGVQSRVAGTGPTLGEAIVDALVRAGGGL